MDGRGRWMANVFIERLWRSLKYECVYLHAFETGSELRAGRIDEIGGMTTTRTELNQAVKLSDGVGPPHLAQAMIPRAASVLIP